MGDESRSATSSVLRWASLGLLAFLVLAVVSGISLTSRGQREMEMSDRDFHSGDLRGSIFHARKAALSYVPGASHVKQAYERLEAIARGAEAQGDEDLARIAWEALRVSVEQTAYPGRPQVAPHERAVKSLLRLKKARQYDDSL